MGPVGGLGAGGDGIVEGFLERNPEGAIGLGHFFGGGTALVELGEPVVFDGTASKDKRFTNHDCCLRHGFFGLLDKAVESRLVRLHRAL